MAEENAGKAESWMRRALRLAERGRGMTSPNPMVGAVLTKAGRMIGQGWHHGAGAPHAEVEALRDARRRGCSPAGSTLYVTLEPCCTHGRTPPCTDALIDAGIENVVVASIDPNPLHEGKGLEVLRQAGMNVRVGVLAAEARELNGAFNHWIVRRTPRVTVKAAMTFDGKIATAAGEARWITGTRARAHGMRLRFENDAILVGVNTVLADDPSLTFRAQGRPLAKAPPLRRIILDSRARTPLAAKVVADDHGDLTTIVVTDRAPAARIRALSRRVHVLVAPACRRRVNLRWLLARLGSENVTSLLVEGGGEVNASFLLEGLAHAVALYLAPKIMGGRAALKAVAGEGIARLDHCLRLEKLHWQRLGMDWLLMAQIGQTC